MIYVAVILGIALFPLSLAWILARWREHWSVWQVVLLGALPLAGSIAALCLFLISFTFFISPEQCAIDQCLEDRDTCVRGLIFALLEFVAGIVSARVGVFLARRDIRPFSEASIFE